MILDGTVSYDDFKKLFNKNQKILQEFVLENYDLDTIEDLAQKKAKKSKKSAKKSRGKNKFESWKFSAKESKTVMLEEMGRLIEPESTNKAQVMHELGNTVLSAVDADSFNVYLVETDGFITSYKPGTEERFLFLQLEALTYGQFSEIMLKLEKALPLHRTVHSSSLLSEQQSRPPSTRTMFPTKRLDD